MIDVMLCIAGLIILTYACATLLARALRSRRRLAKWPLAAAAALLMLAFAVLAVAGLAGVARLERPRAGRAPDFLAPDLQAAGAADALARGRQLAWLCVECHSSTGDLPLNGGTSNLLAGTLPFGFLQGPNLTPGGPLQAWSDGEILRALREGVGADGRALLLMPSGAYGNLSDDDAGALVAFLRSQFALRHDQRPRNLSPLAVMLVGAGLMPTSAQPPVTGIATAPPPVTAPPPGPTPSYGAYLVNISGCRDCHGTALDGVPLTRFAPRGPSLAAAGRSWTPEQFAALFRSGVLPSGATAGAAMPWFYAGKAMSDDDLRAVHSYIASLQ